MKEYNQYGKPADNIVDNIQPGDMVEYIDSRTGTVNKRKVTIHVTLQGIWDGHKVQFHDKEQTVVRSKHWLKLASKCQKCNRKF